MTQPCVLLSTSAAGIATVTLNRPEVGNAYNAAMLDGLIEGLTNLATDPAVRGLVIRGAGKHFQAGADIGWLNEVAHYPPADNYAASVATTKALQLLNEFPKPTIALAPVSAAASASSAASTWPSRRRMRSSASPRSASGSPPRRSRHTWSMPSDCGRPDAMR
jgi:enoyl-CoA hydratase/carnithine racemase